MEIIKKIVLVKPNKIDQNLVKIYQVISLLNDFSKVVEKFVAK